MRPDWRKSTYSGGNGCVETRWTKSTLCTSGTCIEVAYPDGAVQVRDSKQTNSPVLTFGPAAWRAFIDAVKASGL